MSKYPINKECAQSNKELSGYIIYYYVEKGAKEQLIGKFEINNKTTTQTE